MSAYTHTTAGFVAGVKDLCCDIELGAARAALRCTLGLSALKMRQVRGGAAALNDGLVDKLQVCVVLVGEGPCKLGFVAVSLLSRQCWCAVGSRSVAFSVVLPILWPAAEQGNGQMSCL